MKNKLLKIALIGLTNSGKSTLINTLVGEKVSIENKKINTTLESVAGVLNINNCQIIFYDTPGFNLIKSANLIQKKIKTSIWQTINIVDLILYIIDVRKYDFEKVYRDIKKISEEKKPIIFAFNKSDLVNNNLILPFIDKLNQIQLIDDFFIISAKYSLGISQLIKYFSKKSKKIEWEFKLNEISDKSEIFISNECTRNALLKFLHKEIPYNVIVKNKLFKKINKNNLKIKQSIEISNLRYKSIILGNKGATIKRIREASQEEIKSIFNSQIHLYLSVDYLNAK